FKASNTELRPLGRATRGVKSMNFRAGDAPISMDILPAQMTAQMVEGPEGDESEEDSEEETIQTNGPWVLVVTAKGLGKRVPVTQFRLQKRSGLGLRAIKFRQEEDELAALWVVQEDQELMIITQRGVIIRQAADDIAQQSRAATGVRVQRLDEDDAIAAVALVPSVEEDPNMVEDANVEDASVENPNVEEEIEGGDAVESPESQSED
ncbi:MAG: DNA gyrase C-terminal beta-propeller domain-containing protein, partial [Prochlorotrichaceae cyanobacterium]